MKKVSEKYGMVDKLSDKEKAKMFNDFKGGKPVDLDKEIAESKTRHQKLQKAIRATR